MGKYISFGNYNTLYKYIWLHIIIKLILKYFIENAFVEKIKILEDFPQNILIQEGFNYLGTFIFSLFLFKYEINQIKRNSINSFNLKSINQSDSIKEKRSESDIDYIYNDNELTIFKIPNFSLIILLFLSIQLNNIFYIISLKGLDYWMPELLFICVILNKMSKIPIYTHKKVALYFITISCTIMQILSTRYRFIDDFNEKLYKVYIWVIPIGIISFILIILLRSYCFCKINYLLESKFMIKSNFLILYGFFGALICFIISIIPTYIPCADKNDFIYIDLICNLNTTTNNNIVYYYENYSTFFKNLWSNERKTLINIAFLFTFILKIILSFGVKLYSLFIIEKLTPEYYVCSNSIFYFINGLIDFFFYLFLPEGKFKFYKFFATFAQFFSILGTFFYLEFIELKFCKLNYYLKKNIIIRSLSESSTDLVQGDRDSEMSDKEMNE